MPRPTPGYLRHTHSSKLKQKESTGFFDCHRCQREHRAQEHVGSRPQAIPELPASTAAAYEQNADLPLQSTPAGQTPRLGRHSGVLWQELRNYCLANHVNDQITFELPSAAAGPSKANGNSVHLPNQDRDAENSQCSDTTNEVNVKTAGIHESGNTQANHDQRSQAIVPPVNENPDSTAKGKDGSGTTMYIHGKSSQSNGQVVISNGELKAGHGEMVLRPGWITTMLVGVKRPRSSVRKA